MTVLELIKSSLRLLGYTETPLAKPQADALEALNLLLQEWQNEGLLALKETQSFSVSSGTASYSIGDGETWDGTAPVKIITAYLRDSDGYDTGLKILNNVEYAKLHDKDISTKPSKLYYEKVGDNGVVYLYGEPEASYTIKIISNKAFTAYTSLSTTIELPAGYLSALKYSLAVEIAPEYETTPSVWIMKQAIDKKAIIKRTNLKKPSTLNFQGMLYPKRTYNADSDTWQ